jgi:UDP-2-acetamido-3-amino-2,3-dideoxy-glucuronate N-acetyltransferase
MNADVSKGPLSGVTVGRAAFFDDDRGGLGVIDIVKHAPFSPVRLFWIADVTVGGFRGGHAHKLCSQFMICLSGSIRVDAFDGITRRSMVLTRGEFINIVPGIHATETFLVEQSVLLVLCDRPFEADDYIDDEESLIPNAAAIPASR